MATAFLNTGPDLNPSSSPPLPPSSDASPKPDLARDRQSRGERKGTSIAYACLWIMAIAGSLTAPTAKSAVAEIPFSILPPLRFTLAGTCILIWLWPKRGDILRLVRENPWLALGVAAFCVPINQSFFLNGARLAPLSHTAIIYASCPMVVTLLAVAWGLERWSAGRLLAIALSVLGVAVIGWGSLSAGDLSVKGGSGLETFWGDLLLIGAVITWAAYMTINKPLVQKHGALPTLCVTFLGGAALSLPLLWLDPPSSERLSSASLWSWGNFLVLAIFVTISTLALQNICMKRFDASQVAAFGNLSPILTLLWSVLFFGDRLAAELVIGAALTMAGAVWANRSDGGAASPLPPSPIIEET